MIEADELPDRDLLAKADTSPRMFCFVPFELAVAFFTGFFAINMAFHSITYGFVVVPFWLAAMLLVKRDANGVRVFMVQCRLFLTFLDVRRWGGPSATPWPTTGKCGSRRDAV